jgi:hypothetical protein
MGLWDQFTGNFVKWENVGDSVSGEVLDVSLGKDFNGDPAPQLVIETDEGVKTVTAGQKVLQTRLAENRPEVGDEVTITFSGRGEPRAKGQEGAKLFDVEVTRGKGSTATKASDL